jgi:hypothetical protein
MNQHTPAPWWFSENADEGFDIGQGDVSFAEVRKNKSHSIGFGVFDKGDPRANARLIAAAPDLLQALKRIVAGVPDTWIGVIEAKAAIAKATGEH